MKKGNLEDYELFYMELPQADYLDDIEIQDEHDTNNYDEIQGLSAEQVSEIARDSINPPGQKPTDQSDGALLFTDNQWQ